MPLLNPSHFQVSGLFQAASLVVLSYLGFDAISTLAEEALEPRRSIGRATIGSVLLIGTVFAVLTYFAGVVHPDYLNIDPNAGFTDIIATVGGKPLFVASIIAMTLSFGVAGSLEGQTAVARLLYSMGRDKIFPTILAKVHTKYRTPHIATILIGILSVVVALVVGLDILSNLLSFGALTGFAFLNFAVIYYFVIKNNSERSILKHFVSPVIALAIVLYMWINLDPSALWVGCTWFGVGVVYLAFITKGFKRRALRLSLDDPRLSLEGD